jgi:hypothetical protein
VEAAGGSLIERALVVIVLCEGGNGLNVTNAGDRESLDCHCR